MKCALALGLLGASLGAQTLELPAVDSVSIARDTPWVFRDNRIRAFHKASAPESDVVGVYRFDLAKIPATHFVVSLRLTVTLDSAFGSPWGGPVLDVHRSADDAWTRATATEKSAPLAQRLAAGQKDLQLPTHTFTLDLSKFDIGADRKDGKLTLVLVNVQKVDSYVYCFGHAGEPTGPNAVLTVESRTCRGSVTSFGTGGRDSWNTAHQLTAQGCPEPGSTVIAISSTNQLVLTPIGLFLGFSNTLFGEVSLPFDLTLLGAPGNSLYVSLDIGPGVIPNSGGGGSLGLPLPNDPALRGVMFHLQAIASDPFANTLRLVFSNGLTVRIG